MPGPVEFASTLVRSAFGSRLNPVRTNADLLLNAPDGWVSSNGPVPWSAEVGAGSPPVWWVGRSVEDGGSPIGPNGPGGSSSVAAVEHAIGLITGPLTHVWPWRVYRGTWLGADAVPLPVPTWLRDPTLLNDTPGVPAAQQFFLPSVFKTPGPNFWARLVRHALLHGRGWFIHQETDLEGTPVAGTFLVVSPAAVNVDSESFTTSINFGDEEVVVDRSGRFNWDGASWRLRMLPEPLGDGRGVIGRHADLLGMAVNVGRYTSATFASGVPSGYLKVTSPGLTQTQADALKAGWMNAHGSSRGIAVLNATTEFTPITYSPVDADVAEVDHMVTRKVAHAFNLSGWALDAGSTGNDYANITDRRQDKVDDSVMPWKRAVEETLSAALLPYGTWLELETRGYLQSDSEKRMAYFEAGLGLGVFDVVYAQDLERVPAGYRPVEPEPPAPEPAPEATPEGGDDGEAQ